MTTNILFYGNCQTVAIMKTLCLRNNYWCHSIQCDITGMNKEAITDCIQKMDIIITQPISDNYRNVDYLSTSYIINNAKKNCKIIIFDSCYFDFYYFDLTYKKVNNDVLHQPIDYHYNKLIECYSKNLPIEFYIDTYINNEELKTSEELDHIAENSLNELKNRFEANKKKYNSENIYIISIHEFIKNNYKNKLLFYSMNHPSKYVIQYICEEIINFFQIPNTIDYNIDYLDNPRCIIYKCIQKNVIFDINDCLPLTLNNTDKYLITKIYYDTYKAIGFRDAIEEEHNT